MSFQQYLFISSLCISLFYLAYHFLFNRDANFRQSRFFLLFAIAISLIVPFSAWELTIQSTKNPDLNASVLHLLLNSSHDNIAVLGTRTNFHDPDIKIWEWIKWIYLAGFGFFIFRIVLQLTILSHTFFKGNKEQQGSITIVYNKRFKNTFSFFHWIFTPNKLNRSNELNTIINHEKIHCWQYHSLDIILVELLSAVMWFNPLVWRMKSSLQLVHEYLADKGALDTGIETSQYQALLINQLTEERLIDLSSSFNQSLLKKRMIMMTKSKFYHRSKLKILSLIPISGILLVAIALFNGATAKTVSAVEQSDLFLSLAGESFTAMDTDTSKIIVKGQSTIKNAPIKVKGDANVTYILDGKVVENINTISPDEIESINVLKDKNQIIIESKAAAAKKSKKEKLEGSIVVKATGGAESPKKIKLSTSSFPTDNVLYIIDGKTIKDAAELEKLNPESIESISVLKDASKNQLYPDAKDYEGVIVIKTK